LIVTGALSVGGNLLATPNSASAEIAAELAAMRQLFN
jgi:hypothetical protein